LTIVILDTTDNKFILRKIVGKAYECNINLHVLFLDFKKAFDSTKRIKIYEILQQTEMPENYYIIMDDNGKIILENYLSDKLSIFK
jgi:hypothetical protein